MPRKPTCECGECSKCKQRVKARERYWSMTPEERRAVVARRDADKVRASDRARHRRDREKRLAAQREYRKTPQGRALMYARIEEWAERNPEKRRAHNAVSNAVRDGRLHRQPCEVCETTEDVQAHHDDYSRPLDVRWLCRAHHVEHHFGSIAEAA